MTDSRIPPATARSISPVPTSPAAEGLLGASHLSLHAYPPYPPTFPVSESIHHGSTPTLHFPAPAPPSRRLPAAAKAAPALSQPQQPNEDVLHPTSRRVTSRHVTSRRVTSRHVAHRDSIVPEEALPRAWRAGQAALRAGPMQPPCNRHTTAMQPPCNRHATATASRQLSTCSAASLPAWPPAARPGQAGWCCTGLSR